MRRVDLHVRVHRLPSSRYLAQCVAASLLRIFFITTLMLTVHGNGQNATEQVAVGNRQPNEDPGVPSCPCINPWRDDPDACRNTDRGECYPPDYGASSCSAHYCDPETGYLCDRLWCFVDVESCDVASASTDAFGRSLQYSYVTCGVDWIGDGIPAVHRGPPRESWEDSDGASQIGDSYGSGSLSLGAYGPILQELAEWLQHHARTIGLLLDTLKTAGDDETLTNLYRYAQSAVVKAPELYGSSITLEPDWPGCHPSRCGGGEGEGFGPYVYRKCGENSSEAIIPYKSTADWGLAEFESDSNCQLSPTAPTMLPLKMSSNLKTYRSRAWYSDPLEDLRRGGEGFRWTSVYVGGGSGIPMITFSQAFMADKKPMGVVTGDFDAARVTCGANSYAEAFMPKTRAGYVQVIAQVVAMGCDGGSRRLGSLDVISGVVAPLTRGQFQNVSSGFSPSIAFLHNEELGAYDVYYETLRLMMLPRGTKRQGCFLKMDLRVQLAGDRLDGGRPLEFMVLPGPPSIVMSTFTVSQSTHIWQGDQVALEAQINDEFGNIRCRAGDRVFVFLRETAVTDFAVLETEFPVTDNDDGTYSTVISPKRNSTDAFVYVMLDLNFRNPEDDHLRPPRAGDAEGSNQDVDSDIDSDSDTEHAGLSHIRNSPVWYPRQQLSCPSGQYGYKDGVAADTATCLPCAPGSFSGEENAQECTLCPAGTATADGGFNRCTSCTKAQYQPLTGQVSCLDCPAFSERVVQSNQRNSSLASDSDGGQGEVQLRTGLMIDECMCIPDYFSLGVGQPCTYCPEMSTCAGGRSIPVAERGAWVNPLCPVEGYECMVEENCLGPEDGADEGSEGSRCREGHTGPLCQMCQAHWGKPDGDRALACSTCEVLWKQWVYHILLSLVNIVVIFITIKLDIEAIQADQDPPLHSQLLKSVVFYSQILFIISDIEFPASEALGPFLEATGAGGGAADASIISLDCMLGVNAGATEMYFVKVLYHTMIKPLCIYVIVLLVTGTYYGVHRKLLGSGGDVDPAERQLAREQAIVILVKALYTTVYILWPVITQNLFHLFECREFTGAMHVEDPAQCTDASTFNADSKLLWDFGDLAVPCYSGLHAKWVLLLGLPGILVVTIGAPVMMTYTLFRNRRLLSHKNVRLKYGFLFIEYEDEYYWYDIVNTSLKFSLIACIATTKQVAPIYQTLTCLAAVFIFSVILKRFMPYQYPLVDLVYDLVFRAVYISLFCLLALQLNQYTDKFPVSTQTIVVVIFILVNAASLLFIGYHLLRVIYSTAAIQYRDLFDTDGDGVVTRDEVRREMKKTLSNLSEQITRKFAVRGSNRVSTPPDKDKDVKRVQVGVSPSHTAESASHSPQMSPLPTVRSVTDSVTDSPRRADEAGPRSPQSFSSYTSHQSTPYISPIRQSPIPARVNELMVGPNCPPALPPTLWREDVDTTINSKEYQNGPA